MLRQVWSTTWAYHASFEATSLVRQRVEFKLALLAFNFKHWHCTELHHLFSRGLPTRCHYWPPPAAVVDSQHMLNRPDRLMSWRSFRCCRRSETLEQSANTCATTRSKPWTISSGTKDASVWGCITSAPSDFSFWAPDRNTLTYFLLT